MADMLVKLYSLPDPAASLAELKLKGIEIRKAYPDEKHVIADWVCKNIHPNWGKGCEAALEQRPVSLLIAYEKDSRYVPSADRYHLPAEILLGFACYDVAAKGIFGPVGVREDRRGCGIGTGLLLASLQVMYQEGYAYAVIGWAGPTEWYARTAGATLIEDSEPGLFHGSLRG